MITLNILSLCNWPMYLLAWLLPFILGLIFGRSFLGKYKKRITELEQKSTQLNSHANSLEADLNSAKKSKSNLDRENKLLRGQLQDKNDRIKSSESKVLFVKKQHKEELEKLKSTITELRNNQKEQHIIVQELQERHRITEANYLENLQELSELKRAAQIANQRPIEDTEEDVERPEIKPIRIEDEHINRILDQQPIRPDNQNNIEEVDRVKSALSAASLGKVDKIIERIEKKKKKKAKKAKLETTTQETEAVAESEKSIVVESPSEQSSVEVLPPAPEPLEIKRRGRPKGSKNKTTLEKELGRGRRRDNLKKIEGIGPKIEEALRKIGYKTFKRIASATPKELKDALLRESTRFKIATTDTWPHQAQLADEDKWDELAKYQDQIDRGIPKK